FVSHLGIILSHCGGSYSGLVCATYPSHRVWQADEFVEDFVYISDEAARFIVDRGVRLVGIDYLSVGSFRYGGDNVHRILLSGGVWIIEGLDLSGVTSGKYDLICLPLRLAQRDGAPARAILRSV
ncbi:cyclase family protein, partial [Chloroflexota bacterium]